MHVNVSFMTLCYVMLSALFGCSIVWLSIGLFLYNLKLCIVFITLRHCHNSSVLTTKVRFYLSYHIKIIFSLRKLKHDILNACIYFLRGHVGFFFTYCICVSKCSGGSEHLRKIVGILTFIRMIDTLGV